MSSALTLIVLGQAYFIGTPPLAANNINSSDSTPPIYQQSIIPSQTKPENVKQPQAIPQALTVFRNDYEYTPGIGGYKVHTEPLNWYQAKLACEAEHAELAIINSAAESAVIAELFAAAKPHIIGSVDSDYAFIGFNDIAEEGSYKTIHEKPLSESGFYKWASGEPNNGKNQEDCGTVYRDGRLNDAACFLRYAYICELPSPKILETPAEALPEVTTPWRKDYTYTPGLGRHKVHSQAVNWYQAKLACKAEGAELAIINSAAESSIIARLLTESWPHVGSRDSNYAFIGFNDIYDEGSYKTIHDEPLSESGFYEWASGEPNNAGDQEHCGSVYRDGKLNDAACFFPYAFVCELPDPEQDVTTPSVENQTEQFEATTESLTTTKDNEISEEIPNFDDWIMNDDYAEYADV